jgi:uncharacterized protein (TIGR03067 family)
MLKFAVIGGGALAAILVVVLIWIVWPKGDRSPVEPGPVAKLPQSRPTPTPTVPVDKPKAKALDADKKQVKEASKDAADDDGKLPQKKVEKKPATDGSLSADVLRRVKEATTYVRVTWADGRSATGSGFFAIEPGLILTNAHVLDMLEAGRKEPGDIQVFVHSGEASEKRLQGKVVTVDRSSDLAVLRVAATDTSLPEPLVVQAAEGLGITQRVYVFGFPFGEDLGKAITVSPSAVSSLRRDGRGKLKQVQVDGGMNPGNSGGPVVDSQGHVVGVAVSGIRNSQIKFAIPGEMVHSLVEGRAGEYSVGAAAFQNMKISIPVQLELIDPLKRLKKIEIEWWLGKPGPNRSASVKEPQAFSGDGPRSKVPALVKDGLGVAEVTVAEPDSTIALWIQPHVTDSEGKSAWSAATCEILYPAPRPRKISLPVKVETKGTPYPRPLPYQFSSAFTFRKEEGTAVRTVKFFQYLHADEQVKSMDDQGNGKLRWWLRHCNLGILVNGKEIPATEKIEYIMGNIPQFVEFDNDSAGKLTKTSYYPAERRSAELAAHCKKLISYVAPLHIPRPRGDIEPGHRWRAVRPLPVEDVDDLLTGSVDLAYTYRGVSSRDGKECAFIEIQGDVRGEGIGKARGQALVEVESGRLYSAELHVDQTMLDGDRFTVLSKTMNSLTLRLGPVDPRLKQHPLCLTPWENVSFEVNGKARERFDSLWHFKDDKISLAQKQSMPTDTTFYWLRPEIGPNAIDIQTFPPNSPQVRPSLFEIDGDTLKLCIGAPGRARPTDFSTSPNSARALYLFKRVHNYQPPKPPVILFPDPNKNPPKKPKTDDAPALAPKDLAVVARSAAHKDGGTAALGFSAARGGMMSNDGSLAMFTDAQSRTCVVDTSNGQTLARLAAGETARVLPCPDGRHWLCSTPAEIVLLRLPVARK